jgi:hypothetical protein
MAAAHGQLNLHLPGVHPASAPVTVAESSKVARSIPDDGRAQVELGHALFGQKHRVEAALKAYDLALTLNRNTADGVMVQNLVDTFGRAEQPAAAQLIAHFRLVEATPGLKHLATSKNPTVRWGAVQTLDRLGALNKADLVAAWIGDLDSRDCNVRKHAVEELGQEGDTRTLTAIRSVQQRDQKTKQGGFLGLFTHTCLGDAPKQAERKILARSPHALVRSPQGA